MDEDEELVEGNLCCPSQPWGTYTFSFLPSPAHLAVHVHLPFTVYQNDTVTTTTTRASIFNANGVQVNASLW